MLEYLEEVKFKIVKFLAENEDSADYDHLATCFDEIDCYLESDGLYETGDGIMETAKNAMAIINN